VYWKYVQENRRLEEITPNLIVPNIAPRRIDRETSKDHRMR
jgi:hypothetical protein